jgi:hypothetical protein
MRLFLLYAATFLFCWSFSHGIPSLLLCWQQMEEFGITQCEVSGRDFILEDGAVNICPDCPGYTEEL